MFDRIFVCGLVRKQGCDLTVQDLLIAPKEHNQVSQWQFISWCMMNKCIDVGFCDLVIFLISSSFNVRFLGTYV